MADFSYSQKSRRPVPDYFLQNKVPAGDFRQIDILLNFVSPERKILPGRRTGLTSANQRKTARAIKRARNLGLIAFYDWDA